MDALLHLRELRRVQVQALGIIHERAGQFLQFDHGRGVRCCHRGGGRVHLLQLAQQPGRVGEPAEDRRLAFGEFLGHAGGQFDQSPAVRGEGIAGLQRVLLVGAEFRRLDFRHLVAQQFEFALQRGLVGGEAGLVLAQAVEPPPDFLVVPPGGFGVAEGVEQVELPLGAQERLVVVRAVQVDQQVAELLEHRDGRGRAVDELPVAPGLGKRALDDELAVLAAFQPVLGHLGV